MIAAQVASLGEAIACARQAGFAAEQISTLILGSSTASPIVQRKLDLASRYDDADFGLYLLAKDARYGTSLARDLGAPHAVVEAAAEAFSRAERSGLGAKDCAAVALCNLFETGRNAGISNAPMPPLPPSRLVRARQATRRPLEGGPPHDRGRSL
jgi:3-hydroxyisobutyrate dehydrogenase-like beta-hydroxyacid dehydrogenase